MPDSPRTAVPPRVLLVDDHPLFLEGLRNLLTSEGIEVVGLAKDGLEALAQARRLRPDVILMDIQMPVMDGLEATRRIKEQWPEIRVVVLTLYARYQVKALESGADLFLLKGCTPQVLQDAILAQQHIQQIRPDAGEQAENTVDGPN